MAQSFWSRRKKQADTAGSYMQATASVSKPMALASTLIGILLIGLLLFGVYKGARYAIDTYRDGRDPSTVATQESSTSDESSEASSTNDQSASTEESSSASTDESTVQGNTITVTSSTASQPAASNAETVPNTGPTENYLAIFFSVAVLAYAATRRRQLQS
jgi:cytoskeletal protein RodZ